jgi:predicted branched-subunit amino acid permease
MADVLQNVDHAAIRVNQATIILLTLVAFIFNFPILVALVALVMALGTVIKKPGFGFLYFNWLKPQGWVKPDVLRDNPELHRFAQGFGAVVLLGASIAFLAGSGGLGWGLSWLVIFLASLNLFAGFCAGCAVYYWLNRIHVPGFIKSAPEGTFPGLKPKVR